MMNKLLKYEFRATMRLYLPLYLVMLGFSVLGRFSVWGVPWRLSTGEDLLGWTNFHLTVDGDGFIAQVLGILIAMVLVGYALVVLGAMVVHFIITIQRFWKNLMGDEGYLMFTLPVSAGELIWSKAICAFLWGIATTLMVLLSILILVWNPHLREQITWFLADVTARYGDLVGRMLYNIFPPVLWPVMLAEAVVNGFGNLFLLYSAMAIGHTVRNHKVLASIGAYAALTTVMGMAASLLMGAVAPLLTGGEIPQVELFSSTPELLLFSCQLGQLIFGIMLAALVFDLLFSTATFLLTRYLLTSQLNLE